MQCRRYTSLIENIEELVENSRLRFNMPHLAVNHTMARGYVLKVPQEDERNLPLDELVQAVRKGQSAVVARDRAVREVPFCGATTGGHTESLRMVSTHAWRWCAGER